MPIRSIISYKNSWKNLTDNHHNEYEDIVNSLSKINKENLENRMDDLNKAGKIGQIHFAVSSIWEKNIEKCNWKDWSEIENGESMVGLIDYGLKKHHFRSLGYSKNRVSMSYSASRQSINSWIFTVAPMATRSGYVDIPIMFTLLSDSGSLAVAANMGPRFAFETMREELVALSPLSHNNPFLIIGVSVEDGPLEVVELESEADVESRKIVINRAIEFPPEYHQAGLGILNYFGSVLRENYPDEKAKVKIEQDGMKIRLIVETESGNRDIIEKALHEYEMVVREDIPPEALFDSKIKVLELKNELRIAHIRIDSQRDFIEHQKGEVLTLRQLISNALTSSSRSTPVYLNMSPVINLSNNQYNNVNIKHNIIRISESIQELAHTAEDDPELQMRLLDLDEAVNIMSNKEDPEAVKSSSGIKKLKNFIEEANTAGSNINKFLEKVSDGVGIVQDIARHYNNVAEWCGFPQVPRAFLGKE